MRAVKKFWWIHFGSSSKLVAYSNLRKLQVLIDVLESLKVSFLSFKPRYRHGSMDVGQLVGRSNTLIQTELSQLLDGLP